MKIFYSKKLIYYGRIDIKFDLPFYVKMNMYWYLGKKKPTRQKL